MNSMKKGQVSLFILLGLLVLVFVGFFFTFSFLDKKQIDTEKQAPLFLKTPLSMLHCGMNTKNSSRKSRHMRRVLSTAKMIMLAVLLIIAFYWFLHIKNVKGLSLKRILHK